MNSLKSIFVVAGAFIIVKGTVDYTSHHIEGAYESAQMYLEVLNKKPDEVSNLPLRLKFYNLDEKDRASTTYCNLDQSITERKLNFHFCYLAGYSSAGHVDFKVVQDTHRGLVLRVPGRNLLSLTEAHNSKYPDTELKPGESRICYWGRDRKEKGCYISSSKKDYFKMVP